MNSSSYISYISILANMVFAARGGRSGVRECIGTCLAFLLPSLFLLFLLSCRLSLLITISSSTTKNTNTKPPTSIHNTHNIHNSNNNNINNNQKKHSHSLLKCRIFRLFVQIRCNLPFVFVLKIVCLFLLNTTDFPRSQ